MRKTICRSILHENSYAITCKYAFTVGVFLCFIDNFYLSMHPLMTHNFYTSMNLLLFHFDLQTGEKPFKCDQCQRSFSQSSSLSLHKRKNCNVLYGRSDNWDFKIRYKTTLYFKWNQRFIFRLDDVYRWQSPKWTHFQGMLSLRNVIFVVKLHNKNTKTIWSNCNW